MCHVIHISLTKQELVLWSLTMIRRASPFRSLNLFVIITEKACLFRLRSYLRRKNYHYWWLTLYKSPIDFLDLLIPNLCKFGSSNHCNFLQLSYWMYEILIWALVHVSVAQMFLAKEKALVHAFRTNNSCTSTNCTKIFNMIFFFLEKYAQMYTPLPIASLVHCRLVYDICSTLLTLRTILSIWFYKYFNIHFF